MFITEPIHHAVSENEDKQMPATALTSKPDQFPGLSTPRYFGWLRHDGQCWQRIEATGTDDASGSLRLLLRTVDALPHHERRHVAIVVLRDGKLPSGG